MHRKLEVHARLSLNDNLTGMDYRTTLEGHVLSVRDECKLVGDYPRIERFADCESLADD